MSYAPDHIVNDPVTRETLTAGLKKLGLRDGMIVEVHARLSSFDCVIGGARTVVDALMDIAGENGTIVMPVNCHDNAEPSTWKHPVLQPQSYASVRYSARCMLVVLSKSHPINSTKPFISYMRAAGLSSASGKCRDCRLHSSLAYLPHAA